jgi:hypothetical protein
MAASLPYLPSNKNLETLFAKIHSAKIPDKFTHDFLKTTIGLKGSNDRPLIPMLRTLGFVDQSSAPTAAYRLLKSKDTAKTAIGEAIRKAYGPLFAANEQAHKLTGDKLKGLIAQVAGTDESMTARIASTFSTLTKLGDIEDSRAAEDVDNEAGDDGSGGEDSGGDSGGGTGRRAMHPSFHYNIQVHLPSNGTEEVYLNIFNALRKTFQ